MRLHAAAMTAANVHDKHPWPDCCTDELRAWARASDGLAAPVPPLFLLFNL